MIFNLLIELADLTNYVYWLDAFIGILIALIPSVATALLAAFFLDKAFKRSKKLGDSLVKSGIDKVEYASGKMNERDKAILFGLNKRQKPVSLSLCFLTGDNFFLDYYHQIQGLLDNNCTIKVLIASPHDAPRYEPYLEKYPKTYERDQSFFDESYKTELANLYYKYYELKGRALNKLCYLERTYLMVSSQILNSIAQKKFDAAYETLNQNQKLAVWTDRFSKTGDHLMQIILVKRIIESLNKHSKGSKIQLNYYKDEYRIPIILAEYHEDLEDQYYLWTNMNAPVKETTKSVNVFGKTTTSTEEVSYVTDVRKSFDYLFEKYSRE